MIHERRWPLDALVDIIVRRYEVEHPDETLTVDQLATYLGVTKRTIFRWRDIGLTHRAADEAAVALRLHPWSVWPEMIDTDIADAEETYQSKLASNRRMDAIRREQNNTAATSAA